MSAPKIVLNGQEVELGSSLPSGGIAGQVLTKTNSGAEWKDSTENVYSTDEVRIGTWIDGRPLYRKVVIGMSPSVTGATTLAIPISSITDDSIDVVNFYGILHTQNGRKSPIDAYYGTTNYIASVFSDEGYHMYVASYYINCKITVTFEYTKTTDSSNSQSATSQDLPMTELPSVDFAPTSSAPSIDYAPFSSASSIE